MKIGIIGAMEQEVTPLRELLQNLQTLDWKGGDFYQGQWQGADICLLKSGIGKVNAAVGTAVMLQNFAPDLVINMGSAGGFSQKLKVGDLVISSAVIHHDADVTAFGYSPGQLPQMPVSFTADAQLIAQTQEALSQAQLGLSHEIGLIASGDVFMHQADRIAQCRATFPDMIAVDMEAAAIGQTCYLFDTPFVVIRALSDIAGQESPMSFEAFLEIAAKNSVALVSALVAQIISQS